MNPWVGDVFVSILPCWHIFERTAEYYTLTRGVTMVSKNGIGHVSHNSLESGHITLCCLRMHVLRWCRV